MSNPGAVQPRDDAPGFRTHGVSDRDQPQHFLSVADGNHRPPGARQRIGEAKHFVRADPALLDVAARAEPQLAPGDSAGDATAGNGLDGFGGLGGDPQLLCPAQDRVGDWMGAARFQRGGNAEDLLFVAPSQRHDLDDLGPPLGEGAGLVHRNRL